MSSLRTFRLDGNSIEKRETELLAKIESDDGKLIGTFAVHGSGVYYYRPRSHILTRNESDATRESFDSFISFEHLTEVFEILISQNWHMDRDDLSVTEQEGEIILKKVALDE